MNTCDKICIKINFTDLQYTNMYFLLYAHPEKPVLPSSPPLLPSTPSTPFISSNPFILDGWLVIYSVSQRKKPTLETETYLYFVKFVTIYSMVMYTLYGRDWQNISSLRWLHNISCYHMTTVAFFLRSPVKLYTSFPISIRSMVMLFKWPSQFDAIQEE